MPRLLIIKPSSLGDIIHGLQVVESLRSQQPDQWHVTWVVRERFAPLVEACDTVDETLVFRRRDGIPAFLNCLRRIRQRRFDVVLDLQGLARSGLMTLAARAPMKIGRSDAREGAVLTYRKRMPMPAQGKISHAVDILLQALPLLGAKASVHGHLRFKSVTMPEGWASVAETKPIVLFPDSRGPEKEWPYFSELTALAIQHSNRVVVWAGMKSPPSDPNWPKERFLDLTAQATLSQLARLVQESGVVLANDSGPMHLAAALGVPVLALFGPTSPERFGPFPPDRPTNHFLEAPSNELGQLSPETVWSTLERILTDV